MSKCNYIQANIIETKRLLIRKLTNDDFDTLFTIMGKPDVMYAWEQGFSEDDVQKWIERQLIRYAKDGIGYFAGLQKASGQLIGQAGLLQTTMNRKSLRSATYLTTHIGTTVTQQKPQNLS